MDNDVEVTSTGKIEIKRLLAASRETVWRFLVEDDLRGRWLCNGDVEPKEGGLIQFRFDTNKLGATLPTAAPGEAFKAQFDGTVTTFSPPELLAFTWPETERGESTTVTIKLIELGEQTLLHLVHEKLFDKENLVGASAGWHAHLEQLECHLSRKLSPNFWKRHQELDAAYRKKLSETN
tara:strand:- start:706 stop:1242 length:537 start_codon:yes stop_codon:yes gene_type:complete